MISYKRHPGTPRGYAAVYDVLSDGALIGEVWKTEPPVWSDDMPVFESYSGSGRLIGTGATRKSAAALLLGELPS